VRLTKRAKRRLLFLVALVVAGTAAVFTIGIVQDAQRERMRQEERQAGLAAFERGEMQTALDHLKIAVQYGPDDLEVILAFAEARSHVPMPNRAHLHETRAYYDHALELIEGDDELDDRPEQTRDILLKLLHVRGQLGERVEMEGIADRLLADDPDNIEALTAKLLVCMRDRRFEEAMPIAEQLTELQPGDLRWPHLQLQILRSMRAPDDDIIARCDEWIAGHDGDGRMHLLKAAWLFELSHVDQAQREIETAIDRGAGSLEVLQQMLSLLGMVDRHDLIATVIERTRQTYAEAPWARHAVIQYAWRSGQINDAVKELERAGAELEHWPIDLHRDRVLVMMAASRVDEARAALASYRDAVEALPRKAGESTTKVNDGSTKSPDADRALILALSARLSPQLLAWPDMVRRFDDATSIAPDEPVIHYLRGETLARAGEHALASAAFAQAEVFDPTWVAASVAHADSLYALGRIEEAFEVSRAAARRAPRNNLSPLLSLARAAIQLNRLPRNPNEITPVFESEERFAIESARRAAAGMDLTGMMLAIHEQIPTHPAAFSILIEALVQEGRATEAETHMQKWLAQDSLSVEQLVAAADLARRHELGARKSLDRRLREYRGDDPRIPMAHAWLLADDGNPAAGLAVVDRFFANAPPEVTGSDTAQLARISYALAIDHADAWDDLRALVERFPASVPVQGFALSRPEVWKDRPLVEKTIDNLAAALGDRSQQVRLARASYLLRYFRGVEEGLARAVVTVQSVLEESPTSLVALTLLADAYLKGDPPMREQAVEALRIAVDAHQRELSLYPQLISLLQQLGRYDEARRYLAQLGRLNPTDPQFARAEVELLFTQGDFEKALVRAADFINEQSPPSDVLLLAVMHDRTGDAAKAEALFEQLLSAPDADASVRTQAAEFYARHERFDHGFELLQQALADESEGDAKVLLGWFCYRHGQEDRARTHFEEAIAAAPESADAWHALARFHLSRRQFADAVHVAGEGIEATSGDDRLRADLALAVAGGSGQPWREALSRISLQTSDVPALLDTLELAADVSASQPDEADPDQLSLTPAQLEKARGLIETHPRFMPAWYLAIALHAHTNQAGAATELARSAMSRFPNRPEPAEWAVRLFMQTQRWSDALSAAEEWVARTSDDPMPAHCAVALSMLKLDRAKSAADRLRPNAPAIVAARNVHPEQAMVLVDVMLAAGEFDALMTAAAPMLLERAWRMRWAFSARTVDPAVTAMVLMELEERATQSGDGEPGTPEEHISLAAEWQQLAERTGEHQWLQRATALAENVKSESSHTGLATTAEFVLATIDETRGDTQSAEQRYRNVLTMQPNHALALNNLAYLLWQQDEASEEAVSLARRAVDLMPESPDLLDTLGVVLLAVGKPAEAETHLRKALAGRPSDVNIGLNLVDAMLHQNRFDEASRQLELLQRALRRLPGRGVEYEERVNEFQERIRKQLTLAEPS
jgi:tetratricopeptide (TPR) repeat protein